MKLLKPQLSVFLSLFFAHLCFTQPQISGDYQKWHTISISFEGPNTSENNNTNPFLAYRLNVSFVSPSGQEWIVPGFYAADGNAAETSSSSGNIWQVRFTPNEVGTWTYIASFRSGENVAISLDENAGSATSFDGISGEFTITASDKTKPDNRAKGRLNYIGEHYLQFEETKEYFIKAGTDSPENMLAYGDFDNTVNSKNWSPHADDWESGDPVWKGSLGKGLIGAINYLEDKGMNAFSFLTMNVIGDGKDVWPWAAENHADLDGNSDNDAGNRLRYDVSKLEQWEILFAHADSKGMFLHFKTQEQENDQLMDGGDLGTQRKLYYRELIARFGHHLALNWNVGEENTQTDSQRKQVASYIKEIDPYDHHIVVHTYPNDQNKVYQNLLGDASEYTGPSVQTGINNVHEDIKNWVLQSKNAGKKWAVANDEQGGANVGVAADGDYNGDKGSQGDNRSSVRHKVLWGTLMAGGYGVEYYFGYQTGETDLTAQDLRSRNKKWEDAKLAMDFFQQYIPFLEMEPNDGLTSTTEDYCLAQENDTYLIYLPNGSSTNLNLSSANGTYSVKWFDPRNGGDLVLGDVEEITGGSSKNIGNPPNSTSSDWVALIEKIGDDNGNDDPQGNCGSGYLEESGLLILEAESLNFSNGWVQKTDAIGFSGNSYLEWQGGDNFNTPGNGLISTSFEIKNTGTYLFEWRSKVGEGTNSTESNDSWLRFPDADDFFGEKNGSIVYPKGSGKTPNPNGSGSDGWFKVFLSGTTEWTWSTNTSDNDGHKIFVTFNSPGTYTLEISGRSNHHLLDRIVLSMDSSNPRDLTLMESQCKQDDINIISVTGITLAPENPTDIMVEDTLGLTAQVFPNNATNNSVLWSSDNENIASIDENGLVTGISEGAANITAMTVDGNFIAVATVTVLNEEAIDMVSVTDIVLTPENPSNIMIEDTLELTAEVFPNNATNKSVVWSSDNETIASVDENGLVTGISEGTANITVTTIDGNFIAMVSITVEKEQDKGVILFPNPANSNTNINITGIENGTYEMTLYSLSGSLVFQKVIDIQDNYDIELSNLIQGLYVLNLNNSERSYVKKLLVR